MPNTSCQTCSGTCSKCFDGYYLSEGLCYLCAIQCLTCTSNVVAGCLTCKRILNGICYATCPSYYIESAITGSSTFNCVIQTQKSFTLLINKLSAPFPTNDQLLSFNYLEGNVNAVPRVAVNRGLFMNINSNLTSLTSFMLSNQFNFQFVIRPYRPSILILQNRFSILINSTFLSINTTTFNYASSIEG